MIQTTNYYGYSTPNIVVVVKGLEVVILVNSASVNIEIFWSENMINVHATTLNYHYLHHVYTILPRIVAQASFPSNNFLPRPINETGI